VGSAWALILRQPKRQAKKTTVMYFVLFIGTDASLFRDGHIQADKLGDSGPASCGNDEVVGAWRRTVALDAATTREA
jgi:hypothetical protein